MRDAGCGKREIRGHDAAIRQRHDARREATMVDGHRKRRISHPASRIPHPGRPVTDLESDGVPRAYARWATDVGYEGIEERRPRKHDDPRPADEVRRDVGEIGDGA